MNEIIKDLQDYLQSIKLLQEEVEQSFKYVARTHQQEFRKIGNFEGQNIILKKQISYITELLNKYNVTGN